MRKLVFLSGTRADFGKLKSLIQITRESGLFEVHIFATGMHMNHRYGKTVIEMFKCGFDNIYQFINHNDHDSMDMILAKTITGFSDYVKEIQPDLIVVHGDRVEAMAGAIVGALNNVLVAHIEGGELSGTVDELIRHSVSKMAHIHFAANEEARDRLIQMGEARNSVYIIGSPDIDIMNSDTLPSMEDCAQKYQLPWSDFAMVLFHPVTTEFDQFANHAREFVEALQESGDQFVVIYPNNDKGCEYIFRQYKQLEDQTNFRVFPSLRFEHFLTLMKNSRYVIGNSSAGIREAPHFGIPTVNVGTRQQGRTDNPDIAHCGYSKEEILKAIGEINSLKLEPKAVFGDGKSDELFFKSVSSPKFFDRPTQKQFIDRELEDE